MKFTVDISRKGFTVIRASGQSSLVDYLPRTKYDYEAQVNGRQSSIIMACVRWLQRTFPEAPMMLERQMTTGEREQVNDHNLLRLLNSPNAYYDGQLLQSATIADLTQTGNAYWMKVRSKAGRAVELWWVPSTLIEPWWPWQSSDVFIDHYIYYPGTSPVNVPVEDVVHFRDGFDPANIRKGLSPLKSLFREMFTDDEAANMTASLLKNMGVPGMVISPDEGQFASETDSKATKEWFRQHFTGDYRGEPLVMTGPTKVTPFSFSPQQMDLKSLRRIPEERISAVIGVPAVVAGLGAGLDRSTFANYAEARESAYESTVIPMQRLSASVIKRQLLTEFETNIDGWRVGYDLSEVRILQEDENKKVTRVNQMVAGGYLSITDAQRMTGAPVDESQNQYLRAFNLVPVPVGSAAPEMLGPAKRLHLKGGEGSGNFGHEGRPGELGGSGGGGGGSAQTSSERAARARNSYKPATVQAQRAGERNEKVLAESINGKQQTDNAPFDVESGDNVIEVKTIVSGKNDKITMHPESLARKHEAARGKMAHTVVFDNRDGSIYYKQGVGSFRLTTMTRLGSAADVRGYLK